DGTPKQSREGGPDREECWHHAALEPPERRQTENHQSPLQRPHVPVSESKIGREVGGAFQKGGPFDHRAPVLRAFVCLAPDVLDQGVHILVELREVRIHGTGPPSCSLGAITAAQTLTKRGEAWHGGIWLSPNAALPGRRRLNQMIRRGKLQSCVNKRHKLGRA